MIQSLANFFTRIMQRWLPDAFLMSAFNATHVASLHERIVARLERDMIDAELFVSYQAPRRLHEIHERTRVLGEAHDEEGTRLTVRAPAAVIESLR